MHKSFSLSRLKRTATSTGGAKRWLLCTAIFVLVGYLFTASWFAIRIFQKSQASSSSSTSIDDVISSSSIPKQQQQPQKKSPLEEAIFEEIQKQLPTDKKFDENDVHIVFSTGCNLFQHWQAEVVLYSHMKVGQKGRITRVVSGCDTEGEKRKHGKFLTHPEGLADEPVPIEELQKSSHPTFRLHVTPSFPGAREFPWINKPMGLHHWMQNANPPVTESVIVIIDPDQFFMDKLKIDGSRTVEGATRPYGKNGILCTAGCRHGFTFGKSPIGLTDMVKRGRPIGQTYGLGGNFVNTYNVSRIVEPDSQALLLDVQRAERHYSVGPPMMAHIDDMKKIFSKWIKYMHPVFVQHPGDIQADMYAYSFAAAHFGLDHQMFDQYMVSSPLTAGEGWPYVNNFQGKFSCRDPNRGAREPDAAIPTFLHVAQRYDSENTDFMFHKGHVPPNILSCDIPLIVQPPDDLIEIATTLQQKQKMYVVCNAYLLIDEAVTAWRKKFCVNGFNSNHAIMMEKKHQHCTVKEERGTKCWDFARLIDDLNQ